MVQIAGKPFTQLTNLNILDELRVDGALVLPGTGEQIIVEIAGSYLVDVEDDFVSATIAGAINVTLPAASDAVKHVVIKNSPSSTASVTLLPDGSDTIELLASQTLTPSTALTIFPVTGGWLIS